MKGIYRWTKDGPDDHWARVEVRIGEWIDLSKADYDAKYEAKQIEPHFWGLQDEERWHEEGSGFANA